MRILILTLGSRGDVQPYVALGAALRDRGHDVTVTTGRGFEAMIEAAGLAALPLSVDLRELLQTPEVQAAMRSFAGKVRAWRATRGMIRRQLDESWAIARELRPEIIVYHPKSFSAPLLAAALGVPAVPSFLQPAYVPTAAFPNLLLPFAGLGRLGNRLSHRLLHAALRFGTAGVLRRWCRSTPGFEDKPWCDPVEGHEPRGGAVLRLHVHSRHVLPRPHDWGARERITGYWFTAPEDAWQPPEDLARFLAAGPPPVYVGFGSMPAQDAGRLTRCVLEALRATGRRGLLATGWGGLEGLGASDRVHVLEAAPHSWLFPRCAAVVHHGGAGTTHEGLRWGRPSVVCPVFGDQPFWARRVQALGVGPAPLPQKRLGAAALAAALAATDDRELQARAASLGAALRTEPGVAAAVEAIETAGTARG